MKVDLSLPEAPDVVGPAAAAAERTGYTAGWVTETQHDALIGLALASAQTQSIELGSGIAVAFARNPMSMASAANDLQLASQGRLLLGLGSQVRAHITNRYSMPWSAPSSRMREYIAALHAIWTSWNDGTPLKFRGDYYTHTLMTPAFSPGPNPYGPPKIFLAAVGERMTQVAGEAADGLLCHPFTTERYVRDVTRPLVRTAAEAAGRPDDAVELSVTPLLVTGRTEQEAALAATAVRQRIAFYGSTPTYRPVLELHGWGDLQTELWTMSKNGRWAEMGHLIDDEVLDTFAIVAEPEQVAAAISARFGDLADRICLAAGPDQVAALAPIAAELLNR